MSLTLLGLKRATSNTVVQLNLCCEAAARTEIEHRSFGGQTNPRAEKAEEGELDGCGADEVDFCPGSSKPVRNGFKVKVLSPFPMSTNEDGSLPSSPDSPSSPICGAVPGFEEPHLDGRFEQETRALVEDYLRTYAGLQASRISRKQNKPLETLRRVSDSVIEKHRYAFNGIINRLNVDQDMEVGFVTEVAESLFSDGTTNWGRVVSLVAFGAVVARHLKQSGLEHCIEPLGERISSFLLRDKRAWMIENGAWEGFVDFFHTEDPESSVRNALMTFAGLAGIGAGIALLMR
ncbi:induced myeloid leukemia cell differentiation protein Mcl-1 [Huso huso]|uniref:Induced myeloid leukemia cell differentiation protein Mcl-1 n=1 Tax=Huso huso TaxID=61971 RepID=A0ABR0YG65_HUSHU